MAKTTAKVLAFITGLGVLPLVVGLTGCANDRYDQSTKPRIDDRRAAEPGYGQNTDQHIEDNRTAARVRETLAAGADYKYDGVKVMAANGVVQLSGFVITTAQRTVAGEVTRKVAGVKSVENNLMVKP